MSQLFAGTPYEQGMIRPIGIDIDNLSKKYPSLAAKKLPGTPSLIAICGTIPLIVGGAPFACPVSIRLPPQFPRVGPETQLVVPPTVRLSPNRILRPNGFVAPEAIQWIPLRTTLPKYAETLVQLLTQNPPITPDQIRLFSQSPPCHDQRSGDSNTELGIAEADGIVMEANRATEALYMAQVERETLRHMITTVNGLKDEFTAKVGMMSGDVSAFVVPKAVEERAEKLAQERASEDALLELQNEFARERITADEFQTKFRNMTRQHFREFVWPKMEDK